MAQTSRSRRLMRYYFIPLMALVGVALALRGALSESRSGAPAEPPVEPARSRYPLHVSGVGLVEASTRNIAIGTHVQGVVTQVFVKPGDEVNAGDPLFAVDDRLARADIKVRQASLRLAEQELTRLQSMPRPEDVPVAQAKVAELRAELEDAQGQLAIAESAGDSVPKREVDKRRYAVRASRAQLAQAQAQLDLLRAGAWEEDLEVARAQVELARAQVKRSETELERLTVRAPLDAEVLQVNIRVGEFAPTGALPTPLMLLGDTRTLHVRVDVDEFDTWRVRPEAGACASPRGHSALKIDLTFVRIEPYVMPKKWLTGDATERVDTRVLQVLYSFPRGKLPVYVGQQMDVFIDASGLPGAETSE